MPYRCVGSAELENDLVTIPVLTVFHSGLKVGSMCGKQPTDFSIKTLFCLKSTIKSWVTQTLVIFFYLKLIFSEPFFCYHYHPQDTSGPLMILSC